MTPGDLTLGGYAEIQAALKHPDLAQALYDQGEQVMRDALITLHGEAHRARRVMEFGVFTRGFFRDYEKRVFPAVLEPVLCRALEDKHIDLVSLGYEITMNLTAHFAGVDCDPDDPEQAETLLGLVKKFSEGATVVHSTRDLEEVRREVDEALEVFVERFLVPSRQRRLALVAAFEADQIDETKLPRDVMTTLLKHRKAQPLADDVFCREIAFYLQAGAHSTANSTVRALHEIFQWRKTDAQHYSARVSEPIDDPLFLQRCVHESLRLYPASPVAWRRAVAPLELAGRSLKEGDRVILDLAAANRDAGVFGEDAASFNPLRELPNGVWPFGLSFGYGVHACLGRDLDGGVPLRASAGATSPQLGIVTLVLQELLNRGARPDPERAAQKDASTVRDTWSSYPLLLNQQ